MTESQEVRGYLSKVLPVSLLDRVQEQLQNGQVKMHAAAWPAFAYEGDLPGQDFDPLNMQDGLFKGYLMRRVCDSLFCFVDAL